VRVRTKRDRVDIERPPRRANGLVVPPHPREVFRVPFVCGRIARLQVDGTQKMPLGFRPFQSYPAMIAPPEEEPARGASVVGSSGLVGRRQPIATALKASSRVVSALSCSVALVG
jgi:hypothetical protein